MSALFGCVYLDGRSVPPEAAGSMAQALDPWGPDGVSAISRGSAALGFANLAITPEAVHDEMPWTDEYAGLLFTAAARFDNREELCDRLGIPVSERHSLSDGRLALEAYREWGEECPNHLFGDWSLAAWDSRQRSLFLARDHMGNTGLYYCYHPPLFAFASHPEGLFPLMDMDRRIDEYQIASYLALFPLAEEDRTCWRSVRRVLSGCCVTASPQGLKDRRYWDVNRYPALTGRSEEDLVAGFLEHYRTAVRVRLRSSGPIGATLSSGLDSGSVTALAAEALKVQGQNLTAFTSVPLFAADRVIPTARADEWPLARTISARYDNIDHQAVNAASISPLTGVERALAIAHEPLHSASNQFWIMAIHDAAKERGIGVMLTGQLGNGSVSWSGGRDRIFHLLIAGEWDKGMKAMAQWKARHGRSWIHSIAEHLVRPLLRPYWRRARELLRGGYPPWGNQSAIHPCFADRVGLRQAMKAANHDPVFGRTLAPSEERRLTIMRNGILVGPLWHVTGSAFGMEVRDPTADIRLLEYCLSVPADQDMYAGGQRMLIRRAMEGILPPEVQWNTVRGKQAADVACRLLNHQEEMEVMLRRLSADPEVTSYLDLPLMRHVWNELRVKVSPYTSTRASTLLLRGIMCGCFIELAGGRGPEVA